MITLAELPHHPKIRRATLDNSEELDEHLTSCFNTDGNGPGSFKALYPHFFKEGRIGQHFLFVEDGRIAGSVGVYPYELACGDYSFDTAGIGQVATNSDFRGNGIMGELFDHLEGYLNGFDFTWLWGDRLRYSNFGYSLGGYSRKYELNLRSFRGSKSDFSDVDCFDPALDVDRSTSIRDGLLCKEVLSDDEWAESLGGTGVVGVKLGDSSLLLNKTKKSVFAAKGNPEEILRLLEYALNFQEGSSPSLEVVSGDGVGVLDEVCQMRCSWVENVPCCCFRIGNLDQLMSKLGIDGDIEGLSGLSRLELSELFFGFGNKGQLDLSAELQDILRNTSRIHISELFAL